MDLAAVVLALVTAAETADDGFRKVSGLDYVPDTVEAPCIFPNEIPIDFDQAMNRGMDRILVTLRFLCSRTDDREGQHQLYAFLAGSGPASLKVAIESARGDTPGPGGGTLSLGGACDDFHVKRIDGFRWYEHPPGSNTVYVGADLTILVIGSGGS